MYLERNPNIAPLKTEFEALQAEFEQIKRDFEAKLDARSERAEPVWQAIADDLEERAPDVDELRTNSTWLANEDSDPLFDSSREYLDQARAATSRTTTRHPPGEQRARRLYIGENSLFFMWNAPPGGSRARF